MEVKDTEETDFKAQPSNIRKKVTEIRYFSLESDDGCCENYPPTLYSEMEWRTIDNKGAGSEYENDHAVRDTVCET